MFEREIKFIYDFNLNKVAELQNVSVLNVNELAQALRVEVAAA